MKVQLISDTHGKHRQMNIDTSVDMIVHSGDSTNHYDWLPNEIEFKDFIDWYSNLPIQNKILIAGNHDTWALKKYNHEICKELGIIYLEDNYITIENKIIFGSPWVPNFGIWNFMKSRQKLGTFWDNLLINDIDLLVTHGPPKGILDLTENKDYSLERVGCSGLFRAAMKYKPKHHVFGHVHNNKDIINFGHRNLDGINFYNASAVKDGEFHKPPINNKGLIIEI